MSASTIVTCDNDYAVVINVVSAIRNKSTDRAAEEIASYRELCVEAAVQNHRKRDELVVAALTKELESGCATGRAVSLAREILGLYEEVPDHD
jgi:hypothetical protein